MNPQIGDFVEPLSWETRRYHQIQMQPGYYYIKNFVDKDDVRFAELVIGFKLVSGKWTRVAKSKIVVLVPARLLIPVSQNNAIHREINELVEMERELHVGRR